MDSNQYWFYDKTCNQMNQIPGVRFAGVVNKHGRKIAGGFNSTISPLEKDEKKIEMLMMETALDLSMRKEFNNSLGQIKGIVSYRDKANIITFPLNNDNLMLLSSEPELDPLKIIQITQQNLACGEIMEVRTQ